MPFPYIQMRKRKMSSGSAMSRRMKAKKNSRFIVMIRPTISLSQPSSRDHRVDENSDRS